MTCMGQKEHPNAGTRGFARFFLLAIFLFWLPGIARRGPGLSRLESSELATWYTFDPLRQCPIFSAAAEAFLLMPIYLRSLVTPWPGEPRAPVLQLFGLQKPQKSLEFAQKNTQKRGFHVLHPLIKWVLKFVLRVLDHTACICVHCCFPIPWIALAPQVLF